jgi:hypothetical protein
VISRTFDYPKWCRRWFDYIPLLPFLVVLFLKFSLGTIICFLAAFLILSYVYYYHGKLSKTIEVGERGIKGITYSKSIIQIEWEEAINLTEKSSFLVSSRPLFQLVGTDKSQRIIFSTRIENVQELLTLIEEKAVNLKKTKTRSLI